MPGYTMKIFVVTFIILIGQYASFASEDATLNLTLVVHLKQITNITAQNETGHEILSYKGYLFNPSPHSIKLPRASLQAAMLHLILNNPEYTDDIFRITPPHLIVNSTDAYIEIPANESWDFSVMDFGSFPLTAPRINQFAYTLDLGISYALVEGKNASVKLIGSGLVDIIWGNEPATDFANPAPSGYRD